MLRILGIILLIVFILAVLAVLLVIVFFALGAKLLDNQRKEKFGDYYEQAINDETTPIPCKPDISPDFNRIILEKTGIHFPSFEIESCTSLLRHFTGDYHDVCKIRFSDDFDSETIKSIEDHWKNSRKKTVTPIRAEMMHLSFSGNYKSLSGVETHLSTMANTEFFPYNR